MRFTTQTVASLLVNSRGKNITWDWPKSKSDILGYHSESFPNVDVSFVTKFSIVNNEGTTYRGAYVFFEIVYGFRNKKTQDWRDWENYPADQQILGRMELWEFEEIEKDSNVWKNYCKQLVINDDKNKSKVISQT